jgi:hypothetical protein
VQAVASSVASARHTPDHAARTARRGHGELRSLFFSRWVHSCAYTHTDTRNHRAKIRSIPSLSKSKFPTRHAGWLNAASTPCYDLRSFAPRRTNNLGNALARTKTGLQTRDTVSHTVRTAHTRPPIIPYHKPSASSLSDTCTCGRTQVRLRRKPAARSRVHTILWTLMLIAHWPTCWLCTKPRPGGRHAVLTDAFISASKVPFSHPARGFLGHHSLQFLQIGDEIAAASPARNEHFLLAKRAAIHAQLVEGHRVVLLGRIEG